MILREIIFSMYVLNLYILILMNKYLSGNKTKKLPRISTVIM
jgi:hypothetical protein